MISLSEIADAVSLAKKGIPAIEALMEGLKPLLATERDDVKNAVEAVAKAVVDLKGGYEALEVAVKTAIQS